MPSHAIASHSSHPLQRFPVSKYRPCQSGGHALNHIRQHPLKMDHDQNDLNQGQLVVWRWVPHASQPSPAPASTLNPRIIHATARRRENNETDDLPLLLSGNELQSARVALQNNFDSLEAPSAATSKSVRRNPPPSIPHRTGRNQQSFIEKPPRFPSGPHDGTNNAVKETANEGQGGELEVANMLLNMGGSGSNTEKITTSIKQTSCGTKSMPENQSSTKSNKTSNKPETTTKRENLDEFYLQNWIAGSVSLHTPEDDDVLSPLHCFMRRYCVEAFSATAEDVATPRYGKSHGFKVEIGQVGIRCLHCKDCPPGKRAERAVCFPSSLRNIYHSIETWQRRHSLVCKKITPWVRKSILDLMESSKTRAGGRRQYWEDSARRLGMVDTSRGVRFSRKPCDLGPLSLPRNDRLPKMPQHIPEPVVRADDKDLVTDYLFLLMEQMQTCRFTEEDRTGGRSKIKDNEVGFPGMECRHCQGRAGFGRYFPSSVAALSLANSDRNVYNHLQKCRRCPLDVKMELVRLQNDQHQHKNRRGLRKLFFNQIWKRMHRGDNSKEEDKDKKQQTVQEFVPYEGLTRKAPVMMTHQYRHNVHHQVAVNNFREY